MTKDLYNNVKVVNALEAMVVNDDTEGLGPIVDTQGYESVVLAANVGISADTLSGSVFHTLKIQAGDESDLSDASIIPAEAEIQGAIAGTSTGAIAVIDAAAEDPVIVKAGYIGGKRYVRFFNDTTGTHTNGTPMSALWILGHPRVAPVA